VALFGALGVGFIFAHFGRNRVVVQLSALKLGIEIRMEDAKKFDGGWVIFLPLHESYGT
jgi:hypothetical protein